MSVGSTTAPIPTKCCCFYAIRQHNNTHSSQTMIAFRSSGSTTKPIPPIDDIDSKEEIQKGSDLRGSIGSTTMPIPHKQQFKSGERLHKESDLRGGVARVIVQWRIGAHRGAGAAVGQAPAVYAFEEGHV